MLAMRDTPERDTDADWRHIGEAQPFWGVLAGDPFRTENLDEAARTDFYRSGDADVADAASKITRFVGRWPDPARALDFGCGVGRMAFAMAGHAAEVVGYDISPAMLAHARAEPRGEGRVSFTEEWPTGRFDWINSYIVFQHIPPTRGLQLLTRLLKLLAPDGVISLHFAIYRVRGRASDSARLARIKGGLRRRFGLPFQPPVGSVLMYDYDLNRIVAILAAAGLTETAMHHVDHDGHHGVQIVGRLQHKAVQTEPAAFVELIPSLQKDEAVVRTAMHLVLGRAQE